MVRKLWILYVLLACCLALSAAVWSQDFSAADTEEVGRYRLTEAALAKYVAATQALAPVMAENPPPCADTEADSLGAMAARIDAVPGASGALAGAGIASREYIVFGLAAFQAAMGSWALTEGQGELPPGVSAENVEFYQAHASEFERLSGLLPEADCGDEGDYGGEDADWQDHDEREDPDEDDYDG